MTEEMEGKEVVPVDVFEIMDRADDELIKQELKGVLPKVLTYHFKDGKHEVWGLSKAGVDECRTKLAEKGNCIREINLEWTTTEQEAFFVVQAARFGVGKDGTEAQLDTAFGTKRQPKYFATGKENPFWFEQGAAKASRNAAQRLIPIAIKEFVIEMAKREGKTQTVQRKSESPPPETKTEEPKDEKESSTTSLQKVLLDLQAAKEEHIAALRSGKEKPEEVKIYKDVFMAIKGAGAFKADGGLTEEEIEEVKSVHALNKEEIAQVQAEMEEEI